VLILAACTTPPPSAAREPQSRADAGAPGAAPAPAPAVVASSAPAPTPLARAPEAPRWGKAPEASGELFSALDGSCSNISVSVVENAAFVLHGPNGLARVTDDAVEDAPELSKGLEDASGITHLTGRWPDQAYVQFDNGGRCNFTALAARYDGTQWKSAFALPAGMGVTHVEALGGGGAIGMRQCVGCGDESSGCVSNVFMGDNAKAPPFTGDGFTPDTYAFSREGDVFATGIVCPHKGLDAGCATQLRWWRPGGKVGYAVLGPTPQQWRSADGPAHVIVVRSPTEVYVAEDRFFASFDGTRLKPLPPPGKTSNQLLGQDKEGALWFRADDKIWRRNDAGAYADVTPPTGRAGTIAGLEQGAPWALAKDALYKRVGESWQKVALPRPPFSSSASKAYLSPTAVTVRAPDDVFVVATYHEAQPGWNEVERRTTLLRTKRPRETVRCGVGNRFLSWPAPADEACSTPFVMLSEVSATSPKDFDYPKTRAVLAPKVALVADGALAEIRESGRIWNGVVPRTLADGRAIAELYARSFPMTRPEVICAAPTVARTIPITTLRR
jgi:hypothetical protein